MNTRSSALIQTLATPADDPANGEILDSTPRAGQPLPQLLGWLSVGSVVLTGAIALTNLTISTLSSSASVESAGSHTTEVIAPLQ